MCPRCGVQWRRSIRIPLEDVGADRRRLRIEHALAALIASFGLLALALAAVSIYGVVAYSVANRRNEIGIRLALDAQPAQVRGMILRESTWLGVAGIVVGPPERFSCE